MRKGTSWSKYSKFALVFRRKRQETILKSFLRGFYCQLLHETNKIASSKAFTMVRILDFHRMFM